MGNDLAVLLRHANEHENRVSSHAALNGQFIENLPQLYHTQNINRQLGKCVYILSHFLFYFFNVLNIFVLKKISHAAMGQSVAGP